MSHYRTIEVEGTTYRYVVGRHRTNIVDVGLFDNSRIGYVYDEDITEVRPSHIEKVIRRELGIPAKVYDWDTPVTKADPGPKTRGFRKLIGETIVDVTVTANSVILRDAFGVEYSIEGDTTGIVSLRVLGD
jgi:hypothetical protein